MGLKIRSHDSNNLEIFSSEIKKYNCNESTVKVPSSNMKKSKPASVSTSDGGGDGDGDLTAMQSYLRPTNPNPNPNDIAIQHEHNLSLSSKINKLCTQKLEPFLITQHRQN